MSKIKKILFPTEFGPLGEKAKGDAAFLAKSFGAELMLHHAVQVPTGLSRLFSDVNEEEVQRRALEKLESYGKEIDPSGELNITYKHSSGKPEVAIVEVAEDEHCDMIIFGTKGGHGLRDTLLGSAVNHVIRHATCPVLTIRNMPETNGFNRILVPLDLAREAMEKVSWGVMLAKQFNAEIFFYSAGSEDPEEQKRLDTRMDKAVSFAKKEGVEKVHEKREQRTGALTDAVLAYADEVDADLLCIMTQQESESSLRTSLVGTVADRLTNISQRPVLSIRPERHYHTSRWASSHFT